MGAVRAPPVRAGREVNGAGINASFAVQQDVNGKATDYALGWSVALGSPVTFQTTLESEYKSDIFGERGILLGAVHGIVESALPPLLAQGASAGGGVRRHGRIDHRPDQPDDLARRHPRRLRGSSTTTARCRFERAYSAAYRPACDVLEEIYDEVASGNEIQQRRAWPAAASQRYPMGDRSTGPRCGRSASGCGRARRAGHADPPGHGRRLRRHDDGPGRPAQGEGPPLLGDRQRVDHRGGRLAQPLHALQGRRLHGRQLLDHGPPRRAQVGARASTTPSRSRPSPSWTTGQSPTRI